MTYTRDNQGHYIARAFGETITAHNKDALKRLLWQAEQRSIQRAAIRSRMDRRVK